MRMPEGGSPVRSVALAVLLAMVAVACGTRASDEAFRQVLEAGRIPGDSTTAGLVLTPEGAAETRAGALDVSVTAGDVADLASGADPGGGLAESGDDGSSDGDASPGDGGSNAGGKANFASDVGVTADTIKVGSVVSVNGPLGPRQFSPTFWGMNAYVEWLNAQGGVNGRRIELVTCDDRELEEENRGCAEELVEDEGIFAFLGNNTRVWDTGAAKFADDHGVPVVGGYTIGLSYTYFPTIFNMEVTANSGYPRDYEVGQDGFTFATNRACVFWSNQGVERAASIFYSIPISKEAGLNQKACLENQGIDVTTYEINPAVPNWDAVAADMEQRGIQAAFDFVDIVANQNLCRALDRRDHLLDYKVSTIAVQARWVKDDFSSPCRESIYIQATTEPFMTDHPETRRFREVMTKLYQGRFDDELHQWSFDAWLGGIMFREAVESMGANVTRQGLMDWYNALDRYDCHGLCEPKDYTVDLRSDGQAYETCVSFVRWDEASSEFVNWKTADDAGNCFTANWLAQAASYSP
ncbi:MAG TPA: ABC transporter substrate-binding protein [Acidimicrobiales bacterium]